MNSMHLVRFTGNAPFKEAAVLLNFQRHVVAITSSPLIKNVSYLLLANQIEVSEKQGSSLLNNIFSTILNLASLQIRNSPPAAAQTAEFAAVPLDKNCCRKNLQFALRTLFLISSEISNLSLDNAQCNPINNTSKYLRERTTLCDSPDLNL